MFKMIFFAGAVALRIALFSALLVCFAFCFSGCAGSAPAKNSSVEEAEEAAAAALWAMDHGGEALPPQAALSESPGPAASSGGGLSSAGAETRPHDNGGARPAWVDSPDSVYGKERYVAAVGFGGDRRQAERNALANLTGVFGQSVQAEMKTVSSYSEAVKSGVIHVTENNSVQDAITTSAEMDSLVGAEIADVWFDGKSTYYAAAVMEKSRTAVLYADLIRSNERIIADLVNIESGEKNTLASYSRCLLAATIADANRVYANVLTVVGNSSGINPAEMKRGDDYRLMAAEIARNIPIGVSVKGDTANRIGNAFSRALTRLGFMSGGSSSIYVLEGTYTSANAQFENQRNVFVRYNLDAKLMDTSGGAVLLPYNASGREGHLNEAEAEERALRAAEKKITDEFGGVLQEYLSALLPSLK